VGLLTVSIEDVEGIHLDRHGSGCLMLTFTCRHGGLNGILPYVLDEAGGIQANLWGLSLRFVLGRVGHYDATLGI
jgi:hypothetical protein